MSKAPSPAKVAWLLRAAKAAAAVAVKNKALRNSAVVLVVGGAAVLAPLKTMESQELTAYADKLAKGLPTFCSGATDWAMPIGETFTVQECNAIDSMVAIKYGEGILACIKPERLDQNSFDAMTLFAINVGIDGACNSRAARLIRAGDRAAGCTAISTGPDGKPAWSFANGVYVRGLQNRRLKEAALCRTEVTQ
ncbi:MAG: glycoside hydrolase family protein [bacterium]|nr:glycoside hydrolase family protein [bacterium]